MGRSVVTLISGSLVAQLATLAAMPILSRLYSPEAFGEYSIFVSVTLLIAVLATLRYELAIVLPRSVREAAAVKKLTGRLLAASSIFVTAVCVLVALWPSDLSDTWRWLILLIGVEVFVLGWLSLLTFWFTRTQMYGVLSRNRILLAVLVACAQIAMSFTALGGGLGLVVGLLLGQLLAVTVLAVSDGSRNHLAGAFARRRWSYLLRKYWRMPALTTPQTLVDSFRLNGINLVIGQYSLDALGQYSQAWRLVNVPAALIGSALSQVYFPRLATTPRQDLPQVVRSSVGKSLLFGILPFALIFVLSPYLVPWALGPQWGDAGLYAQALTPWLYLNLAASPISTLFVVLDKQHIGLPFSVIYAAAPIAVLALFSSDMYLAIVLMSIVQSILLVFNLGLAGWIARRAALTQRDH
ncbi:oligosaccharide flippase family protein [Microbacterium sp. LWH11-1.2]|uniref:lipopolysaccharide biosynthesis protein n=3 Tax=Bacteria TaxID=2 RepID=UPI003139BFED